MNETEQSSGRDYIARHARFSEGRETAVIWAERIDSIPRNRFDTAMRYSAALSAVLLLSAAALARAADEYRQVVRVKPLQVALDPNFEIRKVKLFNLGDTAAQKAKVVRSIRGDSLSRGLTRDQAAVNFESSYRLFGAVTALDQRGRHGHYFDFFWRVKRPAATTVRLEYRQEKLRTFTQAREVFYQNARGSQHTAFAVIGDDFRNDGRVLAWRCLLIEKGRIVAQEQSFLWR